MGYYSSSVILSAVIVFLSIVLSLFLLSVPSENRKSNRFLAGFLLLTSLDISVFLYDQFINLPPVTEMLRIRLSAFKNPLLYLYILASIYSDFRLRPKHLIHTLPFLIPMLILLPRFFLTDPGSRIHFLGNYGSMPEIKVIKVFGNLTAVIYLSAMVFLLKRFKKITLQNSASENHQITYKWLSQFITIIIFLWTITFLKEILKVGPYSELVNSFRTLVLIFGIGYITWFTLKALHAPHLFRGINFGSKTVNELLGEEPKENFSQEGPATSQREKIRKFMVQEEAFLDPSLNVQDLASKLDIPARELSLIINKEIGKHFFDFVNEYRIEKAKILLADPQNQKITIQEILFDVGFNSKNPFNTAFKKHTGMTPTQYRNQQITRSL